MFFEHTLANLTNLTSSVGAGGVAPVSGALSRFIKRDSFRQSDVNRKRKEMEGLINMYTDLYSKTESTSSKQGTSGCKGGKEEKDSQEQAKRTLPTSSGRIRKKPKKLHE